MRSFLKYVLASMVGVLVASSVLLLIGVAMIGSALSKSDKAIEVKDNSILYLKLNYEIKDRTSKDPFEYYDFRQLKMKPQLGLNDILLYIEKAGTDENIKGIFLDLSAVPAGMSQLEEIRRALDEFRRNNKFVIAHADSYSYKSYYLASVADKVFLTPTGLIEFTGLSAEILYFKKALEKLGVEATIFRTGKYKSAVEPLMQEEMSEANREQISAFLNGTWKHSLDKIAANRASTVDKLDYLADNLSINNTQACLEENLVDSLIYADQVIDYLKSLVNFPPEKDLNMLRLHSYANTPKPRSGKGLAKDQLAVIYAEGDIMTGEGNEGTIGADRLAAAIRKARKDSAVKAIVFRVNSPGGSALASEIILREMDLARKEKPVIASMGNMAASGGYYISCMADTIICNATTLTGSIGVFGALINIREFMNEKAGIHVDVVKTNEHADLFSPFREMESSEKQVIQSAIDTIYTTFLNHVSAGRNLPVSTVESLAQGRIWLGEDAVDNNLADMIGGLDLAIDIAAQKANLEHYRTIELPEQVTPLEEIFKQMGQEIKTFFMKDELGEYYQHIKTLKNMTEQKGIRARLPYDLEIK
ncbi:MAG: signal peptide peptidase SppA [Bacteroidetes bacterium]|jgi:protease-4|nr:signal peptide peptidase SppA [Bacteroidota bacterium]